MNNDFERLQKEYLARENRFANDSRYSPFNQEYLFTKSQLNRHLLNMLSKHGVQNLGTSKILEVGCGTGGVLVDYLSYGASANHIHGVDVLPHRLTQARSRLPFLQISQADGIALPFAAEQFDIVCQYTMFSSILDESIKQKIAQEMLRVLKTNGILIWYDFWWNPTNPATKGIRQLEIKLLFAPFKTSIQRVTLAPPIARKTVPFSWGFSLMLENLKIFNSHLLVVIRKDSAID